jgi:poly(3-hydroxybutyrate) depolymerase
MAILMALVVAACGDGGGPLAPDAAPGTDATTITCTGDEPGTFGGQVLPMGDGQEDRVYWLHVPPGYACMPTALLVDFHGTAFDRPEEAYQTDALIAASDREGFIVVRPRSRSSLEGGQTVYRWDQNPGDLPRNEAYARNLVTTLSTRYAIDPARVYASGFSSGSNMTTRFLADPSSPFHGLAAIAGGDWSLDAPLPAPPAGTRVYLATGYRDYLWPPARHTADALALAGMPASDLLFHRGGGGHDLYAWHWDELWAWLDRGEAPATGVLSPSWTPEDLPDPADVLALARNGDQLVAAGASGHIWSSSAGLWTLELDQGDTDYAALAFGGGGGGVVGGEFALARRLDTGWSSEHGLPDFGGMLGVGWVATATSTAAGRFIVAGNWSAAVSTDLGLSWSGFGVDGSWGGPAQVNGSATGPDGTVVLVGYYDYVGIAAPNAASAVAVDHPVTAEWWNAAAAGTDGSFWVVGDGGAIMATTDHGLTWQGQDSGTDADLYAVSMTPDGLGAAVGKDGVVITTRDGGQTWTHQNLGKNIFLGAVLVEGTTMHVAGEDGFLAHADLALD